MVRVLRLATHGRLAIGSYPIVSGMGHGGVFCDKGGIAVPSHSTIYACTFWSSYSWIYRHQHSYIFDTLVENSSSSGGNMTEEAACSTPIQDKDIDDLILFLKHDTVKIQLHALKLIQGLTVEQQIVQRLANKRDELIPSLLRFVPKEKTLSKAALTSVVNMSQEPRVLDTLLDMKMPNRCMDYVREKTCPGNEQLLIMLLANMTSVERGAAQLLQIGEGPKEGLHLAFLLGHFMKETAERSENGDVYEHVASILPNVTVFKQGRQVVLEPGRGALQALASQLDSSNALRRMGCAGAIKNCFFCCEEDGTEENIVEEEEALNVILAALCGTGYTKKKADDDVRELLAEGIYCLAKSDIVRTTLWKMNAVDLLKTGYEDEENPVVCEAMEGAAEFFLQDGVQQPPEGQEEENSHTTEEVKDIAQDLVDRCVVEEIQ